MTAVDERDLTAAEIRRAAQFHAHKTLGDLLTVLPSDTEIYEWSLRGNHLDGIITGPAGLAEADKDDFHRRALRSLAGLLDIAYEETRHDENRLKAAARGTIAGVEVELWQLVAKCPCDCHHDGGAR